MTERQHHPGDEAAGGQRRAESAFTMSDRAKSTAPSPTGLSRFRRLLPYRKPALCYFIGGLLAGQLFALITGAGIPAMTKTVFPVIFEDKDAPPSVVKFAQSLFGENYVNKLLLAVCLLL